MDKRGVVLLSKKKGKCFLSDMISLFYPHGTNKTGGLLLLVILTIAGLSAGFELAWGRDGGPQFIPPTLKK